MFSGNISRTLISIFSDLFLPWHAAVWGGPLSSAESLLFPALMNPKWKMNILFLNQILEKTIFQFCLCNGTRFISIQLVCSYLFLKGTGHQSAELWQAVVDPVSASLLYDLQNEKSRAGRQLAAWKTTRIIRLIFKGYNPLTPLLFFRARICEALPGDIDPVTGL